MNPSEPLVSHESLNLYYSHSSSLQYLASLGSRFITTTIQHTSTIPHATILADHNTYYTILSATIASIDMDQERGRLPRSSPTKPLRLRNQPSPDRIARNQHLNDDNYQPKPSDTRYPPRTTSLHRGNDQDAFSRAHSREKNHGRQKSNNSSTGMSTLSSAAYTSISDPSARGSKSTAPSPVSSYHSGSTEIIGNFVPVDTAHMALSPLEEERHTGFRDTQSGFSKNKRVINPYEFEPGTPYVVEDARQTTFSDFIGNETSVPSPAMEATHMKNSRSEEIAVYLTRKPTPLNVTKLYPSGHALHRSESSPRLNSRRSPERHNRSPSPGISGYYAEDEASAAPARRGRSRSRNSAGRNHPISRR